MSDRSQKATFSYQQHAPREFHDAPAAVEYISDIYRHNTEFLKNAFVQYIGGQAITGRARAYYPEIRLKNSSYSEIDSRLSYGHVVEPGSYTTTITRPDLFRNYLITQIELLLQNHGQPIEIAESSIPIPLHFALEANDTVELPADATLGSGLRDVFDVPDIAHVNDYIVNGTYEPNDNQDLPLAPFPAQRIDYSLLRLIHYTATSPEHFQNFVLFTNYQFYVDEFCRLAHELMSEGGSPYSAFVEPGNRIRQSDSASDQHQTPLERMPQMPAYHLIAEGNRGITLINIGVGPSNAKTITDHVAVLRPMPG